MLTPYNLMRAEMTVSNDELDALVSAIETDDRCDISHKAMTALKKDWPDSDAKEILRFILMKLKAPLTTIANDETITFERRKRTFDIEDEAQYVIEHMLEHAKNGSWCTWAICESDIHHRWSARGGKVIDQTATLVWSDPMPLILDEKE